MSYNYEGDRQRQMDALRGIPVYFVISERENNLLASSYGLKTILQVIAGDMSQLNDIYERVVNPLWNSPNTPGRQIDVAIYRREPPNPFKPTTESGQEPAV